ncbi:hypothetical protein JG687_00009961 [Phytophthora cactorum]|uniref:Uncharacterized protein n=1 Tax=Phytophthora cactorum TaxID=29920 RepID=A0A8T1UAS9_9STRA|nr:hypothetical protein JG687_00009961 [Phytophthora cactorum]
MEQDTLRRHARMPRRELWRIGDDGTYEDFLDRLPTFVRVKNDLLRCTMNGLCSDHEYSDKIKTLTASLEAVYYMYHTYIVSCTQGCSKLNY